ncbi:MAG TPA: methylated-DNA--[protein]-cysteine S-methyltransferase [Urbifossiella sp.]|nr:methylated-DNA--[protein]-cysteine S-methyltransferase [Urbifossiella sp.]
MLGAEAGDDAAVPIIAEVCRFIEEQLDSPQSLAALGKRAGMSAAHLQRIFKRIVGVSPRQYADARRLERLKGELKGGRSVTRALVGAGYGSTSRLYEKAAGQLGMTPKQYQNGGPAAVIRFATAACDLGRVLLAATERGICALSLGDTDRDLQTFLVAEFPAAERRRDDAGLRLWLEELLRHLAGDRPHLDLPLDVRATAFQRKVWEELRRIPYGETRTYKEVAEALGQPRAVRAVARACATNPASVVIPCHRVVGAGGQLTGYRWGVDRKKKLIAQERSTKPPA